MSEQIIGYGATVERSVDGTTYTAIPECKSIAIPMVETDYLEATSLDSPDGFREYVPGMKDAGVISVSAGYTSAGYVQQLEDNAQPQPIYYRVTLRPQPSQSTGDVFEYRGFPTPSVEGDDITGLIGMTISIRTTGGLDHTPGTVAP